MRAKEVVISVVILLTLINLSCRRVYDKPIPPSGQAPSGLPANPGTPIGDVVQLKSPPYGSFIMDATPTFEWYPLAGADKYLLQVAKDQNFATVVINTTTIGATTYTPGVQLSAGLYYWRVRAEVGGYWTGWSSVWWFVTIAPPYTLEPVVLLTPPYGEHFLTSSSTPTATVNFNWEPVLGAFWYLIRIYSDADLTSLVVEQWIQAPTTSFTYIFEDGAYWWYVAAFNQNFSQASASSIWTFTVGPFPPPALLSPVNGAVITTTNAPPFYWTQVNFTEVTGYQIQIATDPDFTNIIQQANTANTWYNSSPMPDGTYYWRVRATGAGIFGAWSEIRYFVIDYLAPFLPAGPLLIRPINNAKLKLTPTFEWTSTNTPQYQFQLSYSPIFTTQVIDALVQNTVYTPVESQLPLGKYYWRVRGMDAQGAPVTLWSVVRTLYIGASSGDLDGDGNIDIITYSRLPEPGGTANRGAVYFFKGGPGLAGDLSYNNADIIIQGEAANNYFGEGLAVVDLNGDLYDDLVAGAFGYNGNTGRVYIFFGGPAFGETNPAPGVYSSPPAAGVDVVIDGQAAEDKFGIFLDNAGDINGDGYFDLVIQANRADGAGGADTGKVYIFFGKPVWDTWPTSISASSANVIIEGEAANDWFGFHNMGTIGDFNADGFDDMGFGARRADVDSVADVGKVYVFLGRPTWNINYVASSANIIINGEPQASSYLGFTTHKLGDVNKDGYSDFLTGTGYLDTAQGDDAGRGYVFLGSANYSYSSPPVTISAADAQLIITGQGTNSYFSCGLQNSVGDINADGYYDIGVGEPGMARLVIILGSDAVDGNYVSNEIADIIIVSSETSADGITHRFGKLVSLVGDINGDNIHDILIADYRYNSYTGRVYILWGGSSLTAKPGYPYNIDVANPTVPDVRITGFANSFFGLIMTALRY